MGRQVWGTFSVKDHCAPNAFIADVMLYDRLVIPVPPDDIERQRWEDAGWQPERLDRLLRILGQRAYPVAWDDNRRERWKNRYEAGTDMAQATGEWAFSATRTELTEGLPRNVTGIQTVANYTSLEELQKELSLKPAEEGELPLYGGTGVAILGHEFLVPNDPRWTSEELLKEAVALSSERASRRKRAAFWRWQREFLDDKGITDQSAILDAVEEMQDLLEEEKAIVRRKWTRTGTQFAFLAGSVSLGMLSGPLTAVGIGGAFVSVGQFVADKLLEEPGAAADKTVSLLRDIRKHFGWK
jgi:hypothetical protein